MSVNRWLSDILEILNWSEGGEDSLEDFLFQPTSNRTSSKKGDKGDRELKEVGIIGKNFPETLPILPLRGVVVYPHTGIPLTIGQSRSIKLVDDVVAGDRLIGLVASRKPEEKNPASEDLFKIGTMAKVHRMFRAPDGSVRLLVQGIERIQVKKFFQNDPYFRANIKLLPETEEDSVETEALARGVRDQFKRITEIIASIPQELITSVLNLEDPIQIIYTIANFQRMDLIDAQELLELNSVSEKLHKLTVLLTREVEVLEIGQKIQYEARNEIEKMQREYFLREQMKAIQKELGEHGELNSEVGEFRKKIEMAKMSTEAEKQSLREVDRLQSVNAASAEYGVIHTYLDWLVNLPWALKTEDNLDIVNARKILDQDHYGLEDVKERILEYLAVRKLRQERSNIFKDDRKIDTIRKVREGVILCFVGPPGTGKTSLGRSIARAMGREFVRISLGGVRDEAEIRGHRRTYIGALPGRILQALRRVESNNPVFMLDEIDKLGTDFRGDPSSALLEVLDPEQNAEFRDHYIEVGFDLSQVMFITTANTLETIPGPLRDRMEIIPITSYTERDKLAIAKKYLIPRQIRENGLLRREIMFTVAALRMLIRSYTREAGVRNLEREIGAVCRKVVTQIAEEKSKRVKITPKEIKEMLGRAHFFNSQEVTTRTSIPGVATGLAWTPFGGQILFIEATNMPGNKGFKLTGSLGEVMQESAQAGLSYVRSHAAEYGISEDFFEGQDIHVHVPTGAQPKDGPSAGVTMVTAILSMATGISVSPRIGMTGEITLRGQVLPVGGIKEKILAAHRAKLTTVILPKQNEMDLEDLPDEVLRDVKFVFVDTIDQVVRVAIPALHKMDPSKINGSRNRKKNA